MISFTFISSFCDSNTVKPSTKSLDFKNLLGIINLPVKPPSVLPKIYEFYTLTVF